jgi:hypothetical protein
MWEMLNMRYLIHSLFFALTLVAGPLQAQSVPMPPPWPQYFELHGINQAQYNVAVSHTGTVAVSVQWQGDPLTVVITKPNGQQFYTNAKMPPLQAQAAATSDDVKPGAAWKVAVYATPIKGGNPNTSQYVKGSINVQVPGPIASPKVAQMVGQMSPPPAPPRGGMNRPGTIPSDNGQTPDANPSCFAYAIGSGAPANVQCFARRDWCEEHVRDHTTDGGTKWPNMVVQVGCSPAPLYCYSYNNNNSGVCFTSGDECVKNRNNYASQQRNVSIGICRNYTGGPVRN